MAAFEICQCYLAIWLSPTQETLILLKNRSVATRQGTLSWNAGSRTLISERQLFLPKSVSFVVSKYKLPRVSTVVNLQANTTTTQEGYDNILSNKRYSKFRIQKNKTKCFELENGYLHYNLSKHKLLHSYEYNKSLFASFSSDMYIYADT